MAGLAPAIHAFAGAGQDAATAAFAGRGVVDARAKPGHDGGSGAG
jgi:hypothetical protein